MKKGKIKKIDKGLTLVEIVSASVVLMVIVLGTLHFRYHAVLDIEKSKKHLDAVELAAVMVNSWQGFNGAETFDPVSTLSSEISIDSGTGEQQPDGYTLLGKYDITSDETVYHSTMSYKDYDTTLRQLNIIISWPFGNSDNDKTFQMTNYVYME